MNESLLNDLGLTHGEARVYLSLLNLGPSKVGLIVKKSNVASSKVYAILDKLIQKGLVSYIFQGKLKVYSAANPLRLLDYAEELKDKVDETKIQLEKILPLLESKFLATRADYHAEIFEGLRGIRNFFDLSKKDLKKGEVLYTLGYTQEASSLFSGYFKEYHRWKAKQKVLSRVIFTYD
ncbi:MAG: helix-turn-helix domain-containing protein, partial [Candidatus Diapherotrites archaeon]|nr:helix-turn-helix domain-containing protein [Candidatus Diapherotrites archaeon]